MNLVPFAIGLLKGNWKLILGVGLALALIVQTFRLQATEGALSASEAGRAADRSSYEKAQAEAANKALQAKIATEKKYADNADAAQAGYDALRSRYDSILRAKAASGASSGTTDPAQGDGSGVHEAAAAVPVYVQTMPEADWLKLPGLQAYADQCFNWALSLDKVE